MLKPLLTHSCYLTQLEHALAKIPVSVLEPHQLDIQLMKQLNFDPAFSLIQSNFSHTGRPSQFTIQLFRAFFYGARYGLNVKALLKTLWYDPVLCAICGFTHKTEIPCIGSFYNFMARMVPIKENKVVRSPFRKKSKKETKELLGEDGKFKDKRPLARTTQLTTKIMDNKISLTDTPDRFMQELLAKVVVDTSIQAGLIENIPMHMPALVGTVINNAGSMAIPLFSFARSHKTIAKICLYLCVFLMRHGMILYAPCLV